MNPDMEYLFNEGILVRTDVRLKSFMGEVGNAMLIMQALAFENHNKSEPGQWAIGQQSSVLSVPKNLMETMGTVEMELYKALPVPTHDIPIPEILEFKSRNRSELTALRYAMDQIYLDICNSNDIPRSKNHAIARLEKSIDDLNKVANESFPRKLLSSLKIKINIPKIATQALIGSGAAVTFGLSPAVGAAIGAISSAINFDLGLSDSIKNIPDKLRDFAYLHRIEKEL